jgi:hypothetical protein
MKLHKEELDDLYSTPNIVRMIKSKRIRWVEHVVRVWERRSVYKVLVGKPEGRKPRGRHKRRFEDNIKIDLQEVGLGVWTRSIWLRIWTGGRLLRMWQRTFGCE